MSEDIAPVVFDGIARFIDRQADVRVSYFVDSTRYALQFAQLIIGRPDKKRKEVSEIYIEKVPRKHEWTGQFKGLSIDRTVELYTKSYEFSLIPPGEVCTRSWVPFYLGDDGEWHSKEEIYKGESTAVMLNGVRWQIGNRQSNPIDIFADHEGFLVRGKNCDKLDAIVHKLRKSKAPYSVELLDKDDRFVKPWVV